MAKLKQADLQQMGGKGNRSGKNSTPAYSERPEPAPKYQTNPCS